MEQKMDKTEKTHKANKAAIAIVLGGLAFFTAADLAGRYFINRKPAEEAARSTVVVSQEKPKPEPKAFVSVPGDGRLDQGEERPYLLDKNGQPVPLLDDKGKPVPRLDENGKPVIDANGNPVFVLAPNPFYSKYDSHFLDGRCDNSTTEFFDPLGNKVQLLDSEGNVIALSEPLEGSDPTKPNFSPDCARTECGPREGAGAVAEVSRPMVSGETEREWLVPRTLEDIQRMIANSAANPPKISWGDNFFNRRLHYGETCDTSRTPCNAPLDELLDALVEGPCSCPNLQACRPPEQVVVVRPTGPICPNGNVDEGEDCDPPRGAPRTQGCDEGEICVHCMCIERDVTPPPPPPPPRLRQCEGDDASSVMGASGWGTLVTRVQRAVNPAKGNIRSALAVASSPVTATVTVTLRISTSGIPSVQGISARCGGPNEECPGSISLGILTPTGSINLEGVRTGSPSVECLMGVPTPLRP